MFVTSGLYCMLYPINSCTYLQKTDGELIVRLSCDPDAEALV